MANLNQQRAAAPQVIPWASLTDEPWRNGGGVTRQILSRRLAASGEWEPTAANDWDLRLSIARVDSVGAFSRFTGMTRVLTVIEGTSIILTVDGVVEELELFRPFRFDGGAETSSELPNGPIRDLNVMTRIGTATGTVVVETLTADYPRRLLDGQYCVLLQGEALMYSVGDCASPVMLHRYDTLVGDSMRPPTISGHGVLAMFTVSVST